MAGVNRGWGPIRCTWGNNKPDRTKTQQKIIQLHGYRSRPISRNLAEISIAYVIGKREAAPRDRGVARPNRGRTWYLLALNRAAPIALNAPAEAAHLSIVVLPFTNLSGDASQDYFADGITENLTTDLSRIRDSFVIARNTAFTFKGKAID